MQRRAPGLLLFFALAVQSWCAVTVILTRHAEVPPGEANPSLTATGQARANLLATMLRDVHLDTIVVSDLKRTQQTAQAVSETHHLSFISRTQVADVVAVVQARTSGNVLVVGQSKTIPEIISQLGGASFPIGDEEFDNLVILTIDRGQTSTVRLRYGDTVTLRAEGLKAVQGRQAMEISFIKSGGLSPITRVQGTIYVNNGTAEVTGDPAYRRQLARDETDLVRAGADPTLLSRAATVLANKQGRGAADMENYLITIKTSDGNIHQVSLNFSGGDVEGIPPPAAKFLSWLRKESRSILTQKMQPN
jgi:phosphohistidine phosphatase SixA